MMPGDLVCFKSKTKKPDLTHGIVLSEPEMFGFIQRVYVMWSSESKCDEWVDAEDVLVLSPTCSSLKCSK